MAKMPWEKYATASKAVGWVTKKAPRAVRVGKTPKQKLLDAIETQMGYLNDATVGKKSWFRPHKDGDVVKAQVRYGNTPLKISGDSTYVELPYDLRSQFLLDIKDAVEKDRFDAQLTSISEQMSARRTKG